MTLKKPQSCGETLTFRLAMDLESCILAQVRRSADASMCAEDVVLEVLSKHFSRDIAKAEKARQRKEEAPLDRFLPEGVSPFQDVANRSESQSPLDLKLISERIADAPLDKIIGQ